MRASVPCILLLVAVVLAACSRLSSQPDFTYINGPEPESLDPHIISGQAEMRLCQALMEGLTAWNAHGEVVPGVAKSWEISPDGKVYIFHLRESRWSNGESLVASDFVNSWQRALNPALASGYAELYYTMQNAEAYNLGQLRDFSQVGVRAIDDYTLEVRLAHPAPYFLDTCALPILFPVHLASIAKWGDNWIKPGKLVSNGAYILEDWRINDRVKLRKNPYYWRQETVRFFRIDALTTASATTAFNLFYSGVVDLILDKSLVPGFFLDQLKQKPYFQSNPFLGTYFYRINVTRPPLHDSRVRQALALSINKQRLVEKITRAGEPVARSFTPLGIPGYTPPDGLPFDPARARSLLAEAGFPGGRGFPVISILYNSSEQNEQIATEIQAMWRDYLGIKILLKNQEWKVYLNSLTALDYDIARSSWVGDYNDPKTFLDCLVTGRGNNRTGWSNAKYDKLLEQADQASNAKQRFSFMHEAESILVEKELPILPIYFYVGITIFHPEKLGGLSPNVIDQHALSEFFWKQPK